MVPIDYASWWAGLPSGQVFTPWRQYMIECVSGTRKMEPFMACLSHPLTTEPISKDPFINEHELAHFILCPDDKVLDPLWGIEFDGPFEEEFRDLDKARFEVRVLFIQEVILNYTHHREHYLQWVKSPVGREVMLNNKCHPWIGSVQMAMTYCYISPLSTAQVRHEVDHMVAADWTIGKVWSELERKKELVRQLLL